MPDFRKYSNFFLVSGTKSKTVYKVMRRVRWWRCIHYQIILESFLDFCIGQTSFSEVNKSVGRLHIALFRHTLELCFNFFFVIFFF